MEELRLTDVILQIIILLNLQMELTESKGLTQIQMVQTVKPMQQIILQQILQKIKQLTKRQKNEK